VAEYDCEEPMTNAEREPTKAKRVLHLKIRTRSADAEELLSFLREAVPFYESPGGVRVRLLRSIDNPTRFIEIIEYDDRDAFEKDQHRVASDPQMRGYLQTWRSLLAEGVEVETYEDITDSI
jgi:quinol monooxygenase YgiN